MSYSGKGHVLCLGEGHVLYLQSTMASPNSCALLITDYINTTGKCLSFHYRFLFYGSLIVYLMGEDRVPRSLLSVENNGGNFVQEWSFALVILPSNNDLQQIIFLGLRSLAYRTSGIALDDILIRPCSDLGNNRVQSFRLLI